MTPYYADDHVTLYHGDCLAMLDQIEADVLVTDPPYGIAYQSHQGKAGPTRPIANDGDTGTRDAVLAAWGGPALVFGTHKAPAPANVRHTLVWHKTGVGFMGDTKLPWGPAHELVYVIGEGWHGRRGPDVLAVDGYAAASADRPDHPTPKPVGLMRLLIEKCPPGVVLDPFAGSGSTLRAAKDLGRKAIGIEIDRDYCDVIVARLAQEVLL